MGRGFYICINNNFGEQKNNIAVQFGSNQDQLKVNQEKTDWKLKKIEILNETKLKIKKLFWKFEKRKLKA